MKIIVDDLLGEKIAEFLQQHIEDMLSVSPPESKHALDLEALRQPKISFWSIYDGDVLVGCGSLKHLDDSHCEIKSMKTSAQYRGKGVASTLLDFILAQAKQRSYDRVSLETGSMDFFKPARNLYEKFGFSYTSPFANYKEDLNSVFMQKNL